MPKKRGKELVEAEEKIKTLQKEKDKLEEKNSHVEKLLTRHDKARAVQLSAKLRTARMTEEMKRIGSDDVTDRQACLGLGGGPLICSKASEILASSAKWRPQATKLSPALIELFGELPEESSANHELFHANQEVNLANPSGDWQFLEDLFLSSLRKMRFERKSDQWCDSPKLKIYDIKIMPLPLNRELLKRYKSERDRIWKKGDLWELPVTLEAEKAFTEKDVNEYLLFHGTPWKNVDQICQKGFDYSYSGTNKGVMFGKGNYFATYASKADFYSDKDENGNKCMMVARVLLGKSLPRWSGCSDYEGMNKYDSVCAVPKENHGSVDYPEVCVFQNSQAIPIAKITYSHLPQCRCSSCMHENSTKDDENGINSIPTDLAVSQAPHVASQENHSTDNCNDEFDQAAMEDATLRSDDASSNSIGLLNRDCDEFQGGDH